MTVSMERLKQLLDEAADLPEAERAAMISGLRAEDPSLADELVSLLAAYDNAGSFLDAPPRLSWLPADEIEGSHIGPYRVIRVLGRGGMGDVYEAVRDDGEGGGRVALKIMRMGVLSPGSLRRFDIERRALARLDHPNIAGLLDGGTTADGVPYLAMEFVQGERIDEFCDHQRCSVEQRLQIFLAVCAAVQYAHGRLIIHRDLKPGNILVTPEGVPKLLDFGIAKLLEPDTEPASSETTRPGARVFTPEYASPEQAGGGEITTASDVFSLGVLLYVLLTGRRPYDLSGRTPGELLSLIRSQDPAKPSSCNVIVAYPEGTRRARRRMRADLDTIVLTALEKDPAQRYISVEQFAEDIRRHLAHKPILARPVSLPRRMIKFARRHRLLVGASLLCLAGLVGGLALEFYQAKAARAEKARLETINAFLQQMLTFSDPMRQVPGASRTPSMMEDVLDDAARRLESDEFTRQPEVRVQMERILGDAYCHQGRYDLMYKHYHRYIQLRQEQTGGDEAEGLDTLALWALDYFATGKLAQAENLYRRTLPAMQDALDRGKIKAEVLAEALNNFGYLRRTQGDSREAEACFRRVLELSPGFSADPYRVVTTTRATLASALADQGRFEEALRTARDAVLEARSEGISATLPFGFLLTIYGGFLTEKGDLPQADSALSEAGRLFQQLLPPLNLWTGDNLRNRAALLYAQKRYADALVKSEEALHIYRESFGTHYDNYPTALAIRGLSLYRLGRTAEAEESLREALRLRLELMPPGHYFTALARGALGEYLVGRRKFGEAESLLVRSYNDLAGSQGPENPRTLLARARLQELSLAMGKARKVSAPRP